MTSLRLLRRYIYALYGLMAMVCIRSCDNYVTTTASSGAHALLRLIVELQPSREEELGMVAFVLFALFVGFLLYYLLSRVRICRGGSHPGERYPPIARVLAEPELIRYDLKVMHGPVTTGLRFKLLVWLAFTRLGQMFVVPFIKRGSNADAMGGVVLPEKPTLYPTPPYPPPITADYTKSNCTILQKLFDQIVQTSQSDVSSDFHFPTVADYWKAYKAGQCTPTDVAEAALRAIEDSNALRPPLRAIVDTKQDVVMAMAEASTE